MATQHNIELTRRNGKSSISRLADRLMRLGIVATSVVRPAAAISAFFANKAGRCGRLGLVIAVSIFFIHQANAQEAVEPVGHYERAILFSQPFVYWRLGESGGPVASDSSTKPIYNNEVTERQPINAEYNGDITYSETPGIVDDDKAIALNSSANYIRSDVIPSHLFGQGSDLETSDTQSHIAGTIEFWFKRGSDQRTILAHKPTLDATDDITFYVHQIDPGIEFLVYKPDTSEWVSHTSPFPQDSDWHHVVITQYFDPRIEDVLLHIYVDGVESYKGRNNRPLFNSGGQIAALNSERIYIGGDGIFHPGTDGHVDEVALYDRSLIVGSEFSAFDFEIYEHYVAREPASELIVTAQGVRDPAGLYKLGIEITDSLDGQYFIGGGIAEYAALFDIEDNTRAPINLLEPLNRYFFNPTKIESTNAELYVAYSAAQNFSAGGGPVATIKASDETRIGSYIVYEPATSGETCCFVSPNWVKDIGNGRAIYDDEYDGELIVVKPGDGVHTISRKSKSYSAVTREIGFSMNLGRARTVSVAYRPLTATISGGEERGFASYVIPSAGYDYMFDAQKDSSGPFVIQSYPNSRTKLYQGRSMQVIAQAYDLSDIKAVEFSLDVETANGLMHIDARDTEAPYFYDYTLPIDATHVMVSIRGTDANNFDRFTETNRFVVNELELGPNEVLVEARSLVQAENLPTVRSIVALENFDDQLEIARAAKNTVLDQWLLGFSAEDHAPPAWSATVPRLRYTEANNPPDVQALAMLFHDDQVAERDGQDICETSNNYGVISKTIVSGSVGAEVETCDTASWGRFSASIPVAVASTVPASGAIVGNVVATIDIAFRSPIDAATFGAEDVALIGPDGQLAPTSITTNDNRLFSLGFGQPIRSPGGYSLSIGPNIANQLGQLMDMDGDGTGGEVVDDLYKTAFTITYPAPVISEVVPQNGRYQFAPVSTIEVIFESPINASSFTPADVSIIGSQDNIIVASVTSVDDRIFSLHTTAALAQEGDYLLRIGPNIENSLGQKMDQNQDGIGGQPHGDVFSSTFTLDLSAPVISLTSPVEGMVTSNPFVQVTGSVDETSSIDINGIAIGSVTRTFSHYIPLTQGNNNYVLTVTATDQAGKKSSKEVTVTLVDNVKPVIIYGNVTDGEYTNDSNIFIAARTSEGGQLTINGEQQELFLANGYFTFGKTVELQEGANSIVFEMTDYAGNHTVQTLKIVRDTVAPALPTITSHAIAPALNSETSAFTTISGRRDEELRIVVDNLDRDNERVRIIPYGTKNWTITSYPLIEGRSRIGITATDLAGNQSGQTLLLIDADSVVPRLFNSWPPANARMNATNPSLEHITMEYEENGSGINLGASSFVVSRNNFNVSGTVRLDSNLSKFIFTPTTPFLDGNYSVVVIARDQYGNSSVDDRDSVKNFSFQYDRTPPATPIITTDVPLVSNVRRLTIEGTREINTNILLNGVNVSNAGDANWSYSLDLTEGENILSFTARDALLNESSPIAIKVAYDNTAPDPVTIQIDAAGDGTTATVNWDAYDEFSNGDDIKEYRIFRQHSSFNDIGSLQPIAIAATGIKTFTDTELSVGETYHYAVVAVDNSDRLTTKVTSVATTVQDVVAPERPRTFTVTSLADSLVLKWTAGKEKYPAGYKLQVNDNSNTIDIAASVSQHVITDLRPATGYKLWLRAVDSSGNEGEVVFVDAATLLTNPTISETTSRSGSVDISWNAVEPTNLIKHYNVYVSAQPFTDVGSLSARLRVSPQRLTGRIAGLANDTEYYFAVTSSNISNGETLNVTTVAATPLADVTGPTISNVRFGSVELSAGMTIDQANRIYLDATDESGISRVEFMLDGKTFATDSYSANRLTYDGMFDIDLIDDGAYKLLLRAYDTVGNETDTSHDVIVSVAPPPVPVINIDEDSAITNTQVVLLTGTSASNTQVQLIQDGQPIEQLLAVDSRGKYSILVTLKEGENKFEAVAFYSNRTGKTSRSPIYTLTWDTAIPDSPSGLTASARELGQIRLTWDKVGDSRVQSHNVYRAPQPFDALGESGVERVNIGKVYDAGYTDMPLEDGQYYYRVTSLNDLGTESAPSTIASVMADSTGPRLLKANYNSQGITDAATGRMAAGVVDVELTFDEPLRNTPYFALVPKGGLPIVVDLTKDRTNERRYVGDFLIKDSTPAGIASAVMSAQDVLGNRGTEIDEGATLLVDTVAPDLLEINVYPVAPIKIDPQSADEGRTVHVTIRLSDPVKATMLPLVIPHIDSQPLAAYGAGISLRKDQAWSTQIPVWNGSFVLPTTAGKGQSADSQILHFSYRGEDDLGNVSNRIEGQNAFQIYQGDLPPVNIPLALTALAQPGGKIALSWDTVEEASGYQLYRQAPGEHALTEMVTVSGSSNTSYTDDGRKGWQNTEGTGLIDGVYRYAIASSRQHNSQTALSAMSASVSATADGTSPEAPGELQLQLSGGGIVATWQPPQGGINQDDIRYNLYRLQIGEGEPVDLAGITPLQTNIPKPIALDKNPALDAHTYTVTAVDKAGNESLPAQAGYLNFALLPVADLAIALTENGYPQLTWTHGAENISHYDIYIDDPGFPVKLNDAPLTAKSFTDQTYNNGGPSSGAQAERKYTVVAVDHNGTESVGHAILLPALSASVHEPLSQRLQRGIMNEVTFRVDNAGETVIEGARLQISFAAGGAVKEHLSARFDVQAGSFALVPVVLGGYAELSAGVGERTPIKTRIRTTAVSGEQTDIYQSDALEGGERRFVISIATEEFTRGATGKVRFTIENTGAVETEVITALNNGATASNEIRLVLEDTHGNVLGVTPVQQFGGGVVNLSNRVSVARIGAGEKFVSSTIEVPVPAAAPDTIKLILQIDNYHYKVGQDMHVSIAGGQARRDVVLVDTPYTAVVNSITPTTVFDGGIVTISGQALLQGTSTPIPEVPVNIVTSVRGFEKTAMLFADTSGNFSYQYVPGLNESGRFEVSAVHPDVTDRPVHGEFVVQALAVSPTTYTANIPTNYNQELKIRVTTGYETPLSNVRVQYLAEDQISGTYVDGMTIDTGTSIDIGVKNSGYLSPRMKANSNTPTSGSLRLRVVADNRNEPLAYVTVNYTLSEAKPALLATPGFVETGLARDETAIETIRLENKGLADMLNVRLQLTEKDGSSASPWLYLGNKAELGDIAVGEGSDVNINASPTSNVAEGNYEFRLKVTADNMETVGVPVYVAVTQSGKGSVFIHTSDIYTATLDESGNPIAGLAGAKIKLQNEHVLTQLYTVTTDERGEALLKDIPAGHYVYRASAPGHQSVAERLTVKPGITQTEEIFLVNNLVSVEWSVREITLQDRYEIILDATYETDVPVAVAVLEPSIVNLPEMKEGETFYGELRLTNYGLIRAEHIDSRLPENTDTLQYEFLHEFPESLDAGEVFVIPYRITALRDMNPGGEGDSTGGGCYNHTGDLGVGYDSTCPNGEVVAGDTSTKFNANGSCENPPLDGILSTERVTVSKPNSRGSTTSYHQGGVPLGGTGGEGCQGDQSDDCDDSGGK